MAELIIVPLKNFSPLQYGVFIKCDLLSSYESHSNGKLSLELSSVSFFSYFVPDSKSIKPSHSNRRGLNVRNS